MSVWRNTHCRQSATTYSKYQQPFPISGVVSSTRKPTKFHAVVKIRTFTISECKILQMPIPVAERSKAWVCGQSLAGIAGSNPTRAWKSVSCDSCVLSGRDLCDGPITHPEESYPLWYVLVYDLESLKIRRSWPALG